ncbi:hypothetical protein J3A83DRAFT_4184611 [Scleroderma citrinum]
MSEQGETRMIFRVMETYVGYIQGMYIQMRRHHSEDSKHWEMDDARIPLWHIGLNITNSINNTSTMSLWLGIWPLTWEVSCVGGTTRSPAILNFFTLKLPSHYLAVHFSVITFAVFGVLLLLPMQWDSSE